MLRDVGKLLNRLEHQPNLHKGWIFVLLLLVRLVDEVVDLLLLRVEARIGPDSECFEGGMVEERQVHECLQDVVVFVSGFNNQERALSGQLVFVNGNLHCQCGVTYL